MTQEYTTAREDLAKIIAQETAGFVGALPDRGDYELAEMFIAIINEEECYTEVVDTD